jgi:hypothetical protein
MTRLLESDVDVPSEGRDSSVKNVSIILFPSVKVICLRKLSIAPKMHAGKAVFTGEAS